MNVPIALLTRRYRTNLIETNPNFALTHDTRRELEISYPPCRLTVFHLSLSARSASFSAVTGECTLSEVDRFTAGLGDTLTADPNYELRILRVKLCQRPGPNVRVRANQQQDTQDGRCCFPGTIENHCLSPILCVINDFYRFVFLIIHLLLLN